MNENIIKLDTHWYINVAYRDDCPLHPMCEQANVKLYSSCSDAVRDRKLIIGRKEYHKSWEFKTISITGLELGSKKEHEDSVTSLRRGQDGIKKKEYDRGRKEGAKQERRKIYSILNKLSVDDKD